MLRIIDRENNSTEGNRYIAYRMSNKVTKHWYSPY